MVKVGDKVKIVACTYGHELEIGSTHDISEVVQEDYYRIKYGNVEWAVGDDEIELIKHAK